MADKFMLENSNGNSELDTLQIMPDILIDYFFDMDRIAPVGVIYVRPESNFVSYEKAIIKGIQKYADVIYMANLNGLIFIKDALILEHHSSEYRFAIYGKDEMAKYPEMIGEFEKHFNAKFEDAEIIGSFESILKLGINQEELFNTFVDRNHFLRFYGQTIKKINNLYIFNYDLPALIGRYTPKTNVFVIVIKFKNENHKFKEINYSVSDEIINNGNAPIIFSENEMFNEMDMIEKIKRTYHFSKNHIAAMFDMIDFVFKSDGSHLTYVDTLLGNMLINNHKVKLDSLKKLKEYPIVYLKDNGNKRLVNIFDEANDKNLDECIELIKNAVNSNN